ncbi:MAG: T9SS type A sorting domain-containing protein, partial [Candidatus Cloacimonetes bacterium]|nr:T9SS type A sorting domain-containing protein [Candidatus Cloacimonadota bacterium]
TDTKNEREIIVREEILPEQIITSKESTTKPKSELLWEASEGWAICKAVNISDANHHSFVGWYVNYEAWAYFGETNIPIWVYDIVDIDYPSQDMTSDGMYMVGAAGNTIYEFEPSSGNPVWSYSIAVSETIYNIVISDNGNTIFYVSGDAFDHMNITSLDIATSSENWSYELPESGYVWGFTLSKNAERLVILQYSWVTVYSNDGIVLFQINPDTGSQTPPAISDDGSIFVIGDLHGYMNVYEYNVHTSTYEHKWEYLFEWGAYYDWVSALAISGDGSTIAGGSLQFEGGGSYSGELALFNFESNIPLWVYLCTDDKIADIDMSEDGSVIAAASWGPLGDENNDFWIFYKTSDIPVFEYNCVGSTIALDLSSDGIRCIAGGKAVHCRVMGHGGKLYYFEVTPIIGIEDEENNIYNNYVLLQNYPNPFSTSTTISFSATDLHRLTQIKIYNIKGQLVKQLFPISIGINSQLSIDWDGKDENGKQLSNGIYFYSLKIGDRIIDTKKCVILR